MTATGRVPCCLLLLQQFTPDRVPHKEGLQSESSGWMQRALRHC